MSEEEYFRGFVGFVVSFNRGGEPLHDLFFEEAPSSGRLVELLSAVHAGCAAEVEAYLRERGLAGGELPLRSMVLARMAGELTHSFVTDTPTRGALVVYQEEILAACLAYVGACRGGVDAGREGG